MANKCPHCGTKYGFIDRLAQPTMCKRCAAEKLPSVISSFEVELEDDELYAIRAGGDRPQKKAMRQRAKSQFFTGLGICVLMVLLMILINRLTTFNATGVIVVPFLYGGYDLVKGGYLWVRCRPRSPSK